MFLLFTVLETPVSGTSADQGMPWYQWVPWGIAILGAVFGIRGEYRAHQSAKRDKRADAVTPWDEARWLSGDLFAVKNSSTRDVVVTSVEPDSVVTTEVVNNFKVPHELPYRVNAGDSLQFDSEARLALKRPGALIEWHFIDGKQTRSTHRFVDGLVPTNK